MARILWLGDAGCHTGFGRVTHSIGERLVRDYGHEIHVLAVNYRGDDFPSVLDQKQKTLLRLYLPTALLEKDIYGTTRFVEMLGKLGESDEGLDLVIINQDPQVIWQFLYENPYDPQKILLRYCPILAYVPCDGTNLPPQWRELSSTINYATMSQWGKQNYPDSRLIYHGIDEDQFWPVSKDRPIRLSSGAVVDSKRACKEAFGFDPDGFVIGRVDKNSGRKDFGATVKALAPVMLRHKDIQVHFHCAASEKSHGVNMPVMFARWPDIDSKRWFFPGLHNSFIGWTQEDMNGLYNAFDLFVSTSRGEGFGLTLAEAAACSVPVVAQNVSAIPEVVGPGGILLEPQRLLTVPSGEDVWLSDIDAFSDAIEFLYQNEDERKRLGEAGHNHVTGAFNWDVATASFHEYISDLVG